MLVKDALDTLIPQLVDVYGELVDSIILYGSFAKGTQSDDSDIDIAILLRDTPTKTMNDKMIDIVVDLELETHRVLSVIKIDLQKYNQWSDVLPFYKNIHDEGICLWKAA